MSPAVLLVMLLAAPPERLDALERLAAAPPVTRLEPTPKAPPAAAETPAAEKPAEEESQGAAAGDVLFF